VRLDGLPMRHRPDMFHRQTCAVNVYRVVHESSVNL
jgi:hypothetical protein